MLGLGPMKVMPCSSRISANGVFGEEAIAGMHGVAPVISQAESRAEVEIGVARRRADADRFVGSSRASRGRRRSNARRRSLCPTPSPRAKCAGRFPRLAMRILSIILRRRLFDHEQGLAILDRLPVLDENRGHDARLRPTMSLKSSSPRSATACRRPKRARRFDEGLGSGLAANRRCHHWRFDALAFSAWVAAASIAPVSRPAPRPPRGRAPIDNRLARRSRALAGPPRARRADAQIALFDFDFGEIAVRQESGDDRKGPPRARRPSFPALRVRRRARGLASG